jgi:hypothetical protein
MLQNTDGDMADLANVKQLIEQVDARGGAYLGFDLSLEMLLSYCCTQDKTHGTPRSGQINVYALPVMSKMITSLMPKMVRHMLLTRM